MSDRYPRRWRRAWLAWAALTLCLAAVLWSTSGVLLLLVTAAVLTTLVTGLLRSGTSTHQEVLPAREALADGACWATMAVAVITVSMVQGGLAVLVLIAIAVSSPGALRLFLRTGRRTSRSSGAVDVASALHALDMERAREVVHRLDLAGLCWAWTHSSDLLVEVPETPALAAVVALREVYLDEMERRDPTGFNAWIYSDAGVADPPDRFLAPPDEDVRDVA
jgi:hypothetical protein